MKARLSTLSPRAQAVLVAVSIAVLALALWFAVVSPKRAEAARLDDEIAAAQLTLTERRASSGNGKRDSAVVDVFRLAKAMPSSSDQAGLVLELDRLARSSKLELRSIAVQDPVANPGSATLIPVVLVGEGSYRQTTRFLKNARQLVAVRNGKLHATGRLFSVQSVDLVESKAEGFPRLESTITLNAYIYDGPIVSAIPETPVDGSSDQPSYGSTAAGATP